MVHLSRRPRRVTDDVRRVEHHRLQWGPVILHGVLLEDIDASRENGVMPCHIQEDVLGVVRTEGEPVGLVERAGIDAACAGRNRSNVR